MALKDLEYVIAGYLLQHQEGLLEESLNGALVENERLDSDVIEQLVLHIVNSLHLNYEDVADVVDYAYLKRIGFLC